MYGPRNRCGRNFRNDTNRNEAFRISGDGFRRVDGEKTKYAGTLRNGRHDQRF